MDAYQHLVTHRDAEFTTTRWGINDFNLLHELTSLYSPDSYPVDEMHLLYINICTHHFDLLRGVAFHRRNIDPSVIMNEFGLNMNDNQLPKEQPEKPRKRRKNSKATANKHTNKSDVEEDGFFWDDEIAGIEPELSDRDLYDDSPSDEEDASSETDAEENPPKRQRQGTRQAAKKKSNSANATDANGKKKKTKKEQRKDARLPKFIETPEKFAIKPVDWWEMNHDMNKTRAEGGIPRSFGYNIRGIAEYCNRYKAEEWKTFYSRYAPIYFRGRFGSESEHYLRNMDFIRILELCQNHYISIQELTEIEECLERFVEYYDRVVYQRKFNRIILYRPTLHHMGHIKRSIEDGGPMFVFACWVIERVNNLISRCAKNKRDTNRNISINVLNREQFNFLKYTFSEASFTHRTPLGEHLEGEGEAGKTFSGGFATAAERSCAFASFRLYLEAINQEARAEEEGQGLNDDEKERARVERMESMVAARDKDMVLNRGRAHKMKEAFERATGARTASAVGKGSLTRQQLGKVIPEDIRIGLINDHAKLCDWAAIPAEGWKNLKIRSYTGCNFATKAGYVASEFSVSSLLLRARGDTRGNSLVLTLDRDREEEEAAEGEVLEAPETVAEVLYFFRIEKTIPKKPKQRAKKAKFVNPTIATAAPEAPPPEQPDFAFDNETIFALVRYYRVMEDKSFIHISEKPKDRRPGVILATDISGLIGYVYDRGQRVLVNKYGPQYGTAGFNPDLYR